MDPLADTKQTDDPHDASAGLSRQDIELVARADERLAHAYEQIARADEQLARVNEQLSKMEQDAAPKKSANGYRSASGHAATVTFKLINAASLSSIGSRSPVAAQAKMFFAIAARF